MDSASTLFLAGMWDMHGDVGTGWWIVMVVFWVAAIVIGALAVAKR